MTAVSDFAAQQLSKTQMSHVKGGKSWACYSDGIFVGWVQTDTQKQAEDAARHYYGDDVNCTEY